MSPPPIDFDGVLIANRGEIACRIIRSVRALGLQSVAVYSEADAGVPHVQLADQAVCIGPPPAADSYLNIESILAAARATGAGAVHPGYGFLAENAEFAAACEEAGFVFVGPTPAAIARMGNKAQAKRLMQAAGVPCVPGYEGEEASDEALGAAAPSIGYPLMVKAAAGGGGRGMRRVDATEQLADALRIARAEAAAAFGSDDLILERLIEGARHVEIQVLVDGAGHAVHLGERDCSVQRRHQKLIEEAPCPVLTPALRERMGTTALAAAAAIDYRGAGTVEFLLDPDGDFWFLEMNTRLQVEHPVTECLTGLDLVEWQLRIARGESLDLTQSDVRFDGHAIEARLYTEDPGQDFLPATGPIALWRPTADAAIRTDAGVMSGQQITPWYDALAAKIIARGETREIARRRLVAALRDTVLFGPVTNKAFLIACLEDDRFRAGHATTAFCEERMPSPERAGERAEVEMAAAAVLWFWHDREQARKATAGIASELLDWNQGTRLPSRYLLESHDPGVDTGGFDIGIETLGQNLYRAHAPERAYGVALIHERGAPVAVDVDGQRLRVLALPAGGEALWLAIDGRERRFERRSGDASARIGAASDGHVTAPMHGVVSTIAVAVDEQVAAGQRLLVLEAMKMQQDIVAPVAGRVRSIEVREGQQIASGDSLVSLEPTSST